MEIIQIILDDKIRKRNRFSRIIYNFIIDPIKSNNSNTENIKI